MTRSMRILAAAMLLSASMVQADSSVMSEPSGSLDLKALIGQDTNQERTEDQAVEKGGTSSIARLERFIDGLETFEAGFKQIVFDSNEEVVEKSSGYLMIQPPGKFRWEYLDPYPQLIISDGAELWMYDRDLEQVTIQPVDKKLASTPALVLTNRKDLDENYQLFDLGERDGHYWVEMQPKREGEFERIWLAFTTGPLEESVFAGMELRDSFGQSTQLWFVGQRRNKGLKSTVFRFVIPEGVDVIRNASDEEKESTDQQPSPAMPKLELDL